MPQSAKSRKTTRRAAPRARQAKPKQLTAEEIVGLQNRTRGRDQARQHMAEAQLNSAMVDESYVAYVQELRKKYRLPEQFIVDDDGFAHSQPTVAEVPSA